MHIIELNVQGFTLTGIGWSRSGNLFQKVGRRTEQLVARIFHSHYIRRHNTKLRLYYYPNQYITPFRVTFDALNGCAA